MKKIDYIYKSIFSILKSGRISLVTSTLLVSTVISTGHASCGWDDGCDEAQSLVIEDASTRSITMHYADSNLTVTSEGSITINSEVATGSTIYAVQNGNIDNGYITNNGDITVTTTSDDATTGISISGSYNNGTIDNNGTITITTNGDGEGIYGNENNGTITNSGTIKVTANSAYGISTSNNSGIVDNNGTIDVIANENSLGLSIETMDKNATTTNSGNINATSDQFSVGIQTTEMSENATIANSGNINSTSDGISMGILTMGMSDNASITNSGDINVTGDGSNLSGLYYTTGIYATNMYDNSKITNSGTIASYVGNALDANAYSIRVEEMTSNSIVENTSTGKLYGNLNIAGTMSNAGTIVLPYNATGTDAAVVSDYTQTASGKLTISVLNTTADDIVHSQLSTTNATFADGSTIDVNVLSATAGQSLLQGKTLEDVVVASTALTLEGTLNITDNSALLDFNYTENGETIDLTAIAAQVVEDDTSSSSITAHIIAGGGASPAQAVGSALDTINVGNYPGMDSLITSLNLLPTNALVAAAAITLTPQARNAASGAGVQVANGIQGIVDMRQNVRFSGLNSGEQIFTDKYIWMKPYGSLGDQNDKDGINGFDLSAYGLGIGTDAEFAPNKKVGLAFFFTSANVDTNNLNQDADLDVYTLLGYGSVPIIDNKTKFLYQIGYSWQKTDTSRTLFNSDVAKADFTSKTASIDLKVLRDYQMNSAWLLQPLVELTYRNYKTPSYSETGAGAANLNVQSSSNSALIAGMGVISYYNINDSSKVITNVNVGYDFRDDDFSTTAQFQGASGVDFTSNGIDNGRWSYKAGLGYEIDLNKDSNLNFMVNYQGEGSDYISTSISVKYQLKF